MAQPIHGGGVDPVDTQFQRAMNRRDGVGIVLRAPGEFPARATEGPCSETHGRNLQIRVSQLPRFHLRALLEQCTAQTFPHGHSNSSSLPLMKELKKRLER